MAPLSDSYGEAIERLGLLLKRVSRAEFLGQSTPWVPERWILQEGFAYNGRSRTRPKGEMLDGLVRRRSYVEGLKTTQLSRHVVRQHVLAAGEDGERLVEAFIAVMAWGFPPRGFGPYRTSVMLTPASGRPDPTQVLPDVVAELRKNGPLGGYRALMNQLEGCGPAFGTKFLYFASDDSDRAPILDNVVARWIADKKVVGNKDRVISSVGWNSTSYSDYLEFIRVAAQRLGETDVGLLEYVMFVDQQHSDYLATGRSLPVWIRQVSAE